MSAYNTRRCVAARRRRAARECVCGRHGNYGDEGPRGRCPGERACGGGVDGSRQAHRFRRHGGDLGPKGRYGLWHDQSDAVGARCERGALPASRGDLTLPCQPQAISPRRSRARSSSRRSRGLSSRRCAHPLLLRKGPFGHRQLLSFSLSPSPHPGSHGPRHRPGCRPCPSRACARSYSSSRSPLLTPVWQTVQYFYYKLRYTNHQGTLPEFKIEPEHALELLMAANYLDT